MERSAGAVDIIVANVHVIEMYCINTDLNCGLVGGLKICDVNTDLNCGSVGGQGYNNQDQLRQGEYGNRGGPQTSQNYGGQGYGQDTSLTGSGYTGGAGQGNRGGPQTDQSLGPNDY